MNINSPAVAAAFDPAAEARPALNAKCANCGHMYCEHTASGRYCPIGRKHRTLGFTQFNRRTQFAKAGSR
jgi:hypothetical protein